jgi:hypothetical protein
MRLSAAIEATKPWAHRWPPLADREREPALA